LRAAPPALRAPARLGPGRGAHRSRADERRGGRGGAAMKALRQLSCLLLAAGALVGAAEAQERSVVFIHGLKSGPDVWEGAAGRLQQKLMMRPVRPMLDWRATYAQQGGSLLASPTMAGLPSNT